MASGIRRQRMTEDDKLIMAAQEIKDYITRAQGKYLMARHILRREVSRNMTEKEVEEIQQKVIQATIDIASYKDLLRRLYEVTGIPNPSDTKPK
ncbi:hypothetical protein GF312_06535 [Candidatus Poribacteria bacterium]|nr:hypothetical protein [Candidatus Poribacteria bacterium]